MSKAEKIVARLAFDDGSNVDETSGKSRAYKIGQEYKGKGDKKELMKKGLLCEESDLVIDIKTLDKKDRIIAELEKKIKYLNAQIAQYEEDQEPDGD